MTADAEGLYLHRDQPARVPPAAAPGRGGAWGPRRWPAAAEGLSPQRGRPAGVPPLALTGERTLPDVPEENYWYQRHLVVYEWIARQVGGRRVVAPARGA